MPALIQGPLGDYGIARSLIQTPGWNPLEHTDAKGNPMGGKKRGGGFSVRGRGRRPFDHYPPGVHYMDSGLDDLNWMFPTAADMPYDPFYLKNVAQQKKNATAGSYFTGQNLGTGGALATGYVDGVKTLLSAMSPEQKQAVYDTSYEYGGGDFTGGPLSAPDDYDSGYSYDTGYEYQAPVQEYASSSYRPSVNVDYYGL
jgi:hypothetical protein